MGETNIRITAELINAGKSQAGGWNRAQIELLGLVWPMRQGWKDRINGTYIKRSAAEEFIRLRGYTQKPEKRVTELPFNDKLPEPERRKLLKLWVWLHQQPPHRIAIMHETLDHITKATKPLNP